MDWTEILIEIDAKDVDTASDIAGMAVPYGFYIEDYSDLEQGAKEIAHIDLIDEELLQKDRSKAFLHLYISPQENPKEAIDFLNARLDAEGIAHRISTGNIREEDWANNWKRYFKPTPIGKTLLILPEWEADVPTDRKVLRIDPGAAFGTGTHATTKLCLVALESAVRAGDTVLDIGSGSGILSIAALLFGASSAVGVDIDPLAVKTALQNGEKNGFFPPVYQMINGDLAKEVTGTYDICVANIVADVIIRLCETVTRYMKPGGLFIMSGIIDQRREEVEQAVLKQPFEIVSRMEDGGWVCLVARYQPEV